MVTCLLLWGYQRSPEQNRQMLPAKMSIVPKISIVARNSVVPMIQRYRSAHGTLNSGPSSKSFPEEEVVKNFEEFAMNNFSFSVPRNSVAARNIRLDSYKSVENNPYVKRCSKNMKIDDLPYLAAYGANWQHQLVSDHTGIMKNMLPPEMTPIPVNEDTLEPASLSFAQT